MIAVTIKTLDRRPRGGVNYLGETLRNLERAGGCDLNLLSIIDGGSPDSSDFLEAAAQRGVFAESAKRSLHQNAQRAIESGAEIAHDNGAEWVLVLEDDLDFCADFLGSAERWLEDHARDDRRMYAFGANYIQIEGVRARGGTWWDYPVGAFYGAQALAWRTEDAKQLAEWLGPDPYYPTPDKDDPEKIHKVRNCGHDMLLQHWGRSLGLKYFSASAPCFVQHIGRQSSISNRFFEFPWGGRDYAYKGLGQAVASA